MSAHGQLTGPRCASHSKLSVHISHARAVVSDACCTSHQRLTATTDQRGAQRVTCNDGLRWPSSVSMAVFGTLRGGHACASRVYCVPGAISAPLQPSFAVWRARLVRLAAEGRWRGAWRGGVRARVATVPPCRSWKAYGYV